MDNLILMIGNNLSQIRKERGLSLDQVSLATGVSKGMLAQIEKGKKTPSVTILWKIANGLKVSISDLMNESKTNVKIITLDKTSMLTEDDGKYRTGSFLPFNTETKFEVLKMELDPGCIHSSRPHGMGVMEHVFVSSGCLEIEIEDECFRACNGEAIVFQSDVKHTYKNMGEEVVSTFIVIYYTK